MTSPTPHDLISAQMAIRNGATTPAALAEQAIAIAASPACAQVFAKTSFDDLRQAAANPRNADFARRPLAGLSVSVKDLFDVAGQATHAGSVALGDAPPALLDCPAVARLKAAGAGLIGRTHMVEFAFSGVGVNPHFGTPAAWDGLIGQRVGQSEFSYVPGGSSSGAGVSVATGAAFVGLGSDTGGSIRIPAALNGVVGFKSSTGRVPTAGAYPLSTTLDTVCALTRSVRDAVLVHEILAARQVVRSPAPLSAYRFAVVTSTVLDDMDRTVATAFERTLAQLRAAGATVVELALPAIADLSSLQSTGGFTAAEAYTQHQGLIATQGHRYDPRVLNRILRGKDMLAHDYLALGQARQRWIKHMLAALQGFDAVLSPTVPATSPRLADVGPGAERDAAFFKANALLLRNTSVINMLDGCAISLPCHQLGEMPVGLMIWHGHERDDAVLNMALRAEEALTTARAKIA